MPISLLLALTLLSWLLVNNALPAGRMAWFCALKSHMGDGDVECTVVGVLTKHYRCEHKAGFLTYWCPVPAPQPQEDLG